MSRFAVVCLLAALVSGLVVTGCPAMDASRRRDLDEAIFMYQRDLRWQRCGQAAERMLADLRGPFMERCGALEGQLQIESIDVLDVQVEEGAKAATLRVRYTYLLSPSLTLQQVTVTEHWVNNQARWVMESGEWLGKLPLGTAAPRDSEGNSSPE